jgi:predicted HTH domain antitoxin
MNTAKKYLQKQLSVPEFEQAYMEEKVKLDIEYQLEDLKKDIQSCKPAKDDPIKKIKRMSNM